MVYILLGSGFEETEAVAPCDLMRRAGIEVCLVGVDGEYVRSSHGITVKTDCTLSEVDLDAAEMVVLPGGLRGVQTLLASREALDIVKTAWAAGKYVAAICAAPTVLASVGIVGTSRATCYPGMEDRMGEARTCPDQRVVVDGRLITGRAAGSSIDFGLALITALRGEETANKIAAGIVYLS